MPAAPYARPLPVSPLDSPTQKGLTKNYRQRASNTTSHAIGSPSKFVNAFPVLSATTESVLEQNASDVLWKTFVAFEQDCRESADLAVLLPSIEATVASAIDPISLAGSALAECAFYLQTEVLDNIEQALAGASSSLVSSASSDTPRSPCSTASHSKQLTLASSRLSSACSVFRATQCSLKYYGGARKTAYQLDLFIHKYALPTSTAIHKRGQEFSAVSKWLKRVLANEDRILEAAEMAALRKASFSLTKWAQGLISHSEMMNKAAADVRSLMTDRASLHAYSFPPRAPPVIVNSPGLDSPLAIFTDLSVVSPPAQSAQYSYYDPTSTMSAPMSTIMPQSCAFMHSPTTQDQPPLFHNQMPYHSFLGPDYTGNQDMRLQSNAYLNGICM